jgi:putative ABC transport system permease protein
MRRSETAKIGGERSASGPRLRCYSSRLFPKRLNLGPLALHFLRRLTVEWFNILRARLRALFRRESVLRDIEEELRVHVEMETETNIKRGLPPDEARAAALKSFGSLGRNTELGYDIRGGAWLETLWQDLRYGARMLRKNPGFTLIAALTLALGIGANTAIFSIVNAVLLRPLPYDEPDRLVYLHEHTRNSEWEGISYLNFSDWRARNQAFEKIGAYTVGFYNLTGVGEAERLLAAQMSADLFGALRVRAALGRVFTNDEDKPGSNPVVALSHALWRRRFGGDPSVIGRTLILNSRGYTVVGVMSDEFSFPAFPEPVDIWVPLGPLSSGDLYQYRDHHALHAVARLKPDVTIEQARADMKNITASLEKEYPDANQGRGATIIPLLEVYAGDIRRTLYVLLSAVGFVLLIACANVAGLALARAAAREKEMAVRSALGAGPWRIARQLLSESLLLAIAGGGLGVLIAYLGVPLILSISPEDAIPRATEINLDQSVLLFAAAISILTGVVSGLAPALYVSRPDLQETLKETARSVTGRQGWLRRGFVVIEIALTLVLLIGSGLLIRSYLQLQQVNPGFAVENRFRFSIWLPDKEYPDTELDKRINFFNQVRERIAALPGVRSVGMSSGLPLGHTYWKDTFTIVGQPDPPLAETPSMKVIVADTGYFETLHIPLVRGRFFNNQDDRSQLKPQDLQGKVGIQRRLAGLNTVIIDEEFARRHFPGADPIGKQIREGRSIDHWATPPLTIVGVVGRVKMDRLRSNSDDVQAYYPFRQLPPLFMNFTVRTQLAHESLIASVRRQVQEVDPNQPIFDISTLEEIRAESSASDRLNLTLLGVFAAVALALALVGIYGVVSWTVTQRTHEIGLRMALGARVGDVLRLVVGQGMKVVIAGVGLGLAGAFALTRLMKALLFEVSATDHYTFVFVTLLLVGVALLACFIPARRATKVDPTVALRSE